MVPALRAESIRIGDAGSCQRCSRKIEAERSHVMVTHRDRVRALTRTGWDVFAFVGRELPHLLA
jgi:hypothetical protein